MFAEIHKTVFEKLPFVLATVGESPRQAPIEREEGFLYHQFIWVRRGSGSFRVGGRVYELGEGEGMFMRAGVPHGYWGNPMHTAWCTFSMSGEALDYLGIGDHLYFKTPPNLDRETEQLMEFACGDSTPASRSAAGYSFVMELFSTVCSPSAADIATRALYLMEQRYGEQLSLADIAEALGVDRFSLCREYKRSRGVTVMEDLNRIRIAKAKRFLRYSLESVETVGRMCGFESPSYFGKRFREATGTTPGDYRRGGY